jgi:cyanophycinase-like exopeptidase
MGSGETSPTMIKTHRALLARLGPPPVPAALLDTPFGFQANADDIAAKAVEYFEQSVGQEIAVATFRTAGGDTLEQERTLSRLRAARYVFAGPGSPSYALRQWSGSAIPKILLDKLQTGGCVTFASAAALTLGTHTVPVYEIYKVGAEPSWLEGLNLIAEAGLEAVVIPHYDNAEGGHHDTRYCYLGEPRLRRLEAELPPDTFVLGVDEHTGLVLDLSAGTAEVVGRSTITVRKDGRSNVLPAGTVVAIAELQELARSAAGGSVAPAGMSTAAGSAADGAPAGDPAVVATSPLLEAVARHEAAFDEALTHGDAAGAARAILELDDELVAWSRDTLQSDEADRGRAALRSMIVRLGELAEVGARDPAAMVEPFVQTILDARTQARDDKRWADADLLRDRLVALGVEVNDSPQGTSWRLLS